MQFETKTPLAISPVAKDLGVKVSADCKCDYHLNYVLIKLNSFFTTFKRSPTLPNVWLEMKMRLFAFLDWRLLYFILPAWKPSASGLRKLMSFQKNNLCQIEAKKHLVRYCDPLSFSYLTCLIHSVLNYLFYNDN